MLRALGYPHLVSLESFRNPNFPLVANLLVWLVKRFDPDTDLSQEIENVEGRVSLIRGTAEFMVSLQAIIYSFKQNVDILVFSYFSCIQ